ncbi:MAG: DUF1523 family protein [Hellea sp.]|nr:DUF1523 family protein [Hellea sp.]
MFGHIKTAIKVALALGVLLFLHYNLPQHDIVRVVGTFEIRDDKPAESFGAGSADAGSDSFPNRDVRYITTKRPSGKPMVYRNQDTGWGWPPYFKFDTSNLTADAQDLILRQQNGNELWVAVKHYGWRVELMSWYPNAISFKEVEGPHVRLIPWFNIVVLSLLFLLFMWVWLRWRRFRKKRLDPITDKIDESVDAAAEKISSATDAVGEGFKNESSGFRRFMRKWFGSK